MKRIFLVFVVSLLVFACNNDPKITNQEEISVEQQLAKDQASMDSLENAIRAQLGESDSLDMVKEN
jgi:uncharacterized protein YcfL